MEQNDESIESPPEEAPRLYFGRFTKKDLMLWFCGAMVMLSLSIGKSLAQRASRKASLRKADEMQKIIDDSMEQQRKLKERMDEVRKGWPELSTPPRQQNP